MNSTRPAFEDSTFAEEVEATRSRVVLAHVRAATVGDIIPENVHPFHHGPWGFAHNGTLTSYADLAPILSAQAHQWVRPTRS